MPREVTTTGNIPTNYFPRARKRKDKLVVRKTRTRDEEMKMNEAVFAVELVQEYGLDHREALDIVLEQDPEKAAKKMAKKDADGDKDKEKELEAKYREKLKKKMKETGKMKNFGGKQAAPFKKKKDDDDE